MPDDDRMPADAMK